MYKITAHILVFLAASLTSGAAPSLSNTARLSWKCLPENVALFADLACSLNGPSYLVTKNDSSKHDTPGLQPGRKAEHSSWSYKPACTGAMKEIGTELCVYTSVEYAGGRGVSIITTPAIAEKFAALLPFQDSTALDGLLLTGHVSVTPKTQSKGRIALAKQNLKSGDQLASNVPVVVSSHALDDLSGPEREEVLRVAVLRLPVATQRLLARLTWESDGEFLICGYYDHHAGFPVNIGGHNHYALFPELSYFNHACAPKSVLLPDAPFVAADLTSTQIHIDSSTLRTSVQAARNISQGEEITFSYFYPEARNFHFKPFADRQKSMRDRFRWTCSCSRCRAGTRTDDSLEQLRQQQQVLEDWSPRASATPDDALRLIRLYKREGFDTFLDIPYRHAALAYNAVGVAHEAQNYAALAANLMVFDGLEEDPDFKLCQELLLNPWRHWSWRKRIDE